MKKAVKLIAVLMCATFALMSLCGCMQMVIGVNVGTDGTANLNVKMGISDEVYSMLAENENPQTSIDDTKKEAQDQGYSVDEYDENGYKGILMTKSGYSLSSDEADNYMDGLVFVQDKNTLSVTGYPESVNSLKMNMEDSSIDISSFDLRLVLTVPYKITNSNATEISADGKTATFDLVKLDKIELNCSGKSNVLLYTLIAAAAVVIIAVIVIVALVSKKKKTKTTTDTDAENTQN